MSDSCWAKIYIGGTVLQSQLPTIANLLDIPSADELLIARNLVYEDMDAFDGMFGEAELYLQNHHIPFDRENAAHYNWGAEKAMYRPETGMYSQPLDTSGEPVIRFAVVKKAYEELKQLTNGGVFDSMRLKKIVEDLAIHVWEPEPLPPLKIIEPGDAE